MKRIALAVACAAMFLLGYGAAVKAWPGVPDRSQFYGYFLNIYDWHGPSVIEGGYPSSVNSAESFITFVKDQLYSGSTQNRTGAAFTIQTMLAEPWNRNRPPTADQIYDWESRVRAAERLGRITWNANFTYSGNSLYQGGFTGTNPNDDTFYYENGTRLSIIFRTSSGVGYAIKRDCGNPLTYGYMPGLEESWNSAAWTTVPATASPGQTVTFSHFINVWGETSAPRIWRTSYEGASSAGTNLPNISNDGPIAYNTTINPINENFTIPNNAAAGTKYCRAITWDPITAWGDRYGAGPEACVTVVISAKLKAAMSASPPTIAAGDTTNFTPSISANSNASPITVNCSVSRTQYTPSGTAGTPTSLPCVTTGGDSNITVGTGASVTLRANTFTAPDNIAIGTKICDTITITNPTGTGYYDNPADQTSTACAVVAKSPYVHFTGGDVWAGGGFAAVNPSCNGTAKITTVARSRALTVDNTTPGSGVTYAAFALDKISNFGSGSAALVAATGVGDGWTFSNINTSNLGYYGAPQHCITDYAGTYSGSPTIGAGTVDVAAGGSGSWRINGDVTLHGAVGAGIKKVYYVTGNVTIDNNVTYPANFNPAGTIPSLVVIATGDIYVGSGVAQMDGIFITRGTFYTCWPKTEPATVSTCNTQLVVNGSVSATSVDLFRTAGAEGATAASQKAAAEVFNLSPEVYINNALNESSTSTITTTNVRELPPRF